MEYNYITLTHPDHEGGEYETNYRWYWKKDENGKWIEVEEQSEGQWYEYDGFEKKSDLTRWIKDNEKEIRAYRKMVEQERKHDQEIARIEALMAQGVDNEAAEEMVLENGLEAILECYEERDLDAELEQERQRIERECLEALGIAA